MKRSVLPRVVLFVEVVIYLRYAQSGAQFHFWLHGLFGGAIGLAGVTLLRVARPSSTTRAWGPSLGGHVYSAFPDVLFLSIGLLHATWMDVFAVHVSVHLVPSPLLTMWTVFTLTLAAYVAAETGRRTGALSLVGAAIAVLGIGLALRDPIPSTLDEVRTSTGLAFVCPLASDALR